MEQKARHITERQKRFADFYLETGNARRAAAMAGYSEDYAPAAKRQPAVERYLRERIDQMDSERIAGADEVLQYLTGVLRGEMEEAGKGAEKAASARMKAAELLGKRLGVFEAKEGGAEPAVIIDDIPS